MAGNDSVYNHVPEDDFRVICPYEFDLSSVEVIMPLYVAQSLPPAWGNVTPTALLVFKRIFFIYTEATSADAGVGIRIGRPTNYNQYHSFTTETSKSQWDVTEVAAADMDGETRIFSDANYHLVLVRCIGGKTGTGKVMVGAEFSHNYLDWPG